MLCSEIAKVILGEGVVVVVVFGFSPPFFLTLVLLDIVVQK